MPASKSIQQMTVWRRPGTGAIRIEFEFKYNESGQTKKEKLNFGSEVKTDDIVKTFDFTDLE